MKKPCAQICAAAHFWLSSRLENHQASDPTISYLIPLRSLPLSLNLLVSTQAQTNSVNSRVLDSAREVSRIHQNLERKQELKEQG